MRNLYLLILGSIVFHSTYAQSNYSITVFGTDKVQSSVIGKEYKVELDEMVNLYQTDYQAYLERRQVFTTKLKKQLPEMGYIYPLLLKGYVGGFSYIIDFVEQREMTDRMDFKEIESKGLEDPDGLIAKWNAYESLSNKIFEKGELGSTKCPVYHCTWAFDHPDLKPFLDYFSKYVTSNKEKLIEILYHSEENGYRSASPFLLAHSEMEAQELVDTLAKAINDPNRGVRNNSMRVIYYIVKEIEDINIDLDLVIDALDYPSFSDRNKALTILRSLPLTLSDLTKSQKTKMLPILIEVLEKKDPSGNRSSARRILKKLSGLNHGESDWRAWKKWAETV